MLVDAKVGIEDRLSDVNSPDPSASANVEDVLWVWVDRREVESVVEDEGVDVVDYVEAVVVSGAGVGVRGGENRSCSDWRRQWGLWEGERGGTSSFGRR